VKRSNAAVVHDCSTQADQLTIARLGPFRLVISAFSDFPLANGLRVPTATHVGGGGREERGGEVYFTRCNLSAKIIGRFGLYHDDTRPTCVEG